MADLGDILSRVGSARGITLASDTDPTQAQAIEWVNDGILFVTSVLARFGVCLEKLTGLILGETATGSAGLAPLPAGVLTILAAQIGTASPAAYKVSTLVSPMEVLRAQANASLADTSAPIYSFGASTATPKLLYAPVALTSIIYTSIKKPAALATPASDNLPFDGDLRIPVQFYTLWQMWEQKERNSVFANAAKEGFFYYMQALTGLRRQDIERVVSTPI